MVFDINKFNSHPNKLLADHIKGVVNNVKGVTSSKIAELVAIFHDLGKVNPNFQKKLVGEIYGGYDKHSYLSSYLFFCLSISSQREKIEEFLGYKLTPNDIVGITTLMAKHHGNIPDFMPENRLNNDSGILSKKEKESLIKFVNETDVPTSEFLKTYFIVDPFPELLKDKKVQSCFLDKFIFSIKGNTSPLDFFQDIQFAFASTIQADKVDAASFDNFIKIQNKEIIEFSKIFNDKLKLYLNGLQQNSDLNVVRTEIRNTAINNIKKGLEDNQRVFELTSPTGSGKTLMLLSLASEIIRMKGAKRIIYSLPFLSITEQVEQEVLKIFKGDENYIQRIDSKSNNKRLEKLQEELDNKPEVGKDYDLELLEFQENTFSYPMIITTFVRFIETLLSNKNTELLKLPNFSNCIFLIDEIQALPPRLYSFFVAYLTEFCKKFDSFLIISTATQPNFELPQDNSDVKDFFKGYSLPHSLVPTTYFFNDIFNRYNLYFNNNPIGIEDLCENIIKEGKSVLIILNTISDTEKLYSLLCDKVNPWDVILLNTHFTPRDRKLKIYLAKRRLRESKRIIVISTQLIEAGVDIDFPIVYRDFTTISSIVQSAGRCNRNGKYSERGKVYLFVLYRNGKRRAELIFRDKDAELLRFTKKSIEKESYCEKDLLVVQNSYFMQIQKELFFARYGKLLENDFLKDIRECMFDKIGRFSLIDKANYGEEFQYYIPKNDKDLNFEELIRKKEELKEIFKSSNDMSLIRKKKNELKMLLKKMSNQIVLVNLKANQNKPLLTSSDNYFGLYKIDKTNYSFITGIDLSNENCIL